MSPAVSIVLPTFNRLQYLRSTVTSVLTQTFSDWELIIADDGSDDRQLKEYLHALASDSRVRLLWLGHSGIPAAVRNAALREAKGEYVAFLDSDDLWAPEKLARQLEALQACPRCNWSYTAFSQIDGNDRPLAEEARRRWVPYEGSIFEHLVVGPISIRTPSVLAARRLIERAGGFDETLRCAEDQDLWLRLALDSDVVVVNEALVQVRRHEENHTRDWESAFIGRDLSLQKMQHRVNSMKQRALLRAERTRNAVRLATLHALRGDNPKM